MLVLSAALGWMWPGKLMAQSFTVLHNFNPSTSNDGGRPGHLILSSNTLYGVATEDGAWGNGTVFKMNIDGTCSTNLYNFTPFSNGTNSDGATPIGAFVLSNNKLFGTAYGGGAFGNGTVFALNTDGTGFTNLHSFTGSEGIYPGALALSAGTLYGPLRQGGDSTNGMIFAINTDGTGFRVVHSFTPSVYQQPIGMYSVPTNSDGANPYGPLVVLSNTLYGVAAYGGTMGFGTIFAVNTDGSAFTNLHNFSAIDPSTGTNWDGTHPEAGLVLSGNTLYGTACSGGTGGNGAVFALGVDGAGFTNPHSFAAGWLSNGDGLRPFEVSLSGNTLFGVAQQGGSTGLGTVFALPTDGTSFQALHRFTQPSDFETNVDGGFPVCLIAAGSTLYGTASVGGSAAQGVVFSISLLPQLGITLAATNAILTWPTNVAGFDTSGFALQSTTNLISPIWANVSPAPTIINGQNTVTNLASGTQQFYRLAQ